MEGGPSCGVGITGAGRGFVELGGVVGGEGAAGGVGYGERGGVGLRGKEKGMGMGMGTGVGVGLWAGRRACMRSVGRRRRGDS